jgi:abequosyltransferase
MENNIILSICIPTYNRAKYLDDTIFSIVQQKRFLEASDVEIVISDNCSNDNTSDICKKYIGIHGEKIRYYRNDENIEAANIERVLSYGKGIFLKLNNDTLMHQVNSLDRIIEVIDQNKDNREILFFSNGTLKDITSLHCKDLNSFVKNVSFYSTWIACFGIWKEDFKLINNFTTIEKTLLINDVLFKMIISNRPVLVDNYKLFNSLPPVTKGGYNFYKVFVTNYLGLLEEYRVKKKISRGTLFNEKSKLLKHFLIPWSLIMLRNKKQYSFDKKGAVPILMQKYRFHPLFYPGIIYVYLRLILTKFKLVKSEISM